MGELETWTSQEFGAAHEGRVGVLLADGTQPDPVVSPSSSGAECTTISHWSVYDGKRFHGPRAAALRALCSCGWTGPERPLDSDTIGDQPLHLAAHEVADTCTTQWDEHIEAVAGAAIPLPAELTDLLGRAEELIGRLERDAPLAALRAARHMEVVAQRLGYWPAHDVRRDMSIEQAAAGLGLDTRHTRALMARMGDWSPYA